MLLEGRPILLRDPRGGSRLRGIHLQNELHPRGNVAFPHEDNLDRNEDVLNLQDAVVFHLVETRLLKDEEHLQGKASHRGEGMCRLDGGVGRQRRGVCLQGDKESLLGGSRWLPRDIASPQGDKVLQGIKVPPQDDEMCLKDGRVSRQESKSDLQGEVFLQNTYLHKDELSPQEGLSLKDEVFLQEVTRQVPGVREVLVRPAAGVPHLIVGVLSLTAEVLRLAVAVPRQEVDVTPHVIEALHLIILEVASHPQGVLLLTEDHLQEDDHHLLRGLIKFSVEAQLRRVLLTDVVSTPIVAQSPLLNLSQIALKAPTRSSQQVRDLQIKRWLQRQVRQIIIYHRARPVRSATFLVSLPAIQQSNQLLTLPIAPTRKVTMILRLLQAPYLAS